MNDEQPHYEDEKPDQGLFKRYPKLSIILIAIVAYGLLMAMCAVVAVLLIRG